jgi:hypothetical protein
MEADHEVRLLPVRVPHGCQHASLLLSRVRAGLRSVPVDVPGLERPGGGLLGAEADSGNGRRILMGVRFAEIGGWVARQELSCDGRGSFEAEAEVGLVRMPVPEDIRERLARGGCRIIFHVVAELAPL